MKFSLIEEMAKNVAEKAFDEYEDQGKTLRQWVEILKDYDDKKDTLQRIVERLEEENTLIKEQRKEAIEYDDEQIIFATNNQIRSFDYSLRVIREEGGIHE